LLASWVDRKGYQSHASHQPPPPPESYLLSVRVRGKGTTLHAVWLMVAHIIPVFSSDGPEVDLFLCFSALISSSHPTLVAIKTPLHIDPYQSTFGIALEPHEFNYGDD
jgi:hypothetical protein